MFKNKSKLIYTYIQLTSHKIKKSESTMILFEEIKYNTTYLLFFI